jgi:hypothetical protein
LVTKICTNNTTTKKRTTLTAIAAIFLAATLVVAGTVAVTTAARPAYAITFGSTKNLSSNDGDSTNPQVQVSSSNDMQYGMT